MNTQLGPGSTPTPPPGAPPAISIRSVSKSFGDLRAVNAASLDIPAGSLFGLVGPNGAGKTTLLSMLTGLLPPDSGELFAAGVSVWNDPVRAKSMIGVLADNVKLFDRLTGAQLISYSGMLHRLDRQTVASRCQDLLQLLGLTEAQDKLVVDYSAGMTKKVALGCALIHAPKILVLDEPFEAVDPISAANIRDVLSSFVNSGGTVVVSSHSMELVEKMCDRVAVFANGTVVSTGTLDEVRAGVSLEDRFVQLVGGRVSSEGPAWLTHS